MVKNYFFLGVAIVIASIVLGVSAIVATQPKASVLVRGLAQREVDANLAIWRMSYSLGGNELAALQSEINTKNAVITEFLLAHGLSSDDFSVLPASITDISLDMYGDKSHISYTFIATATTLVRTSKIKELQAAFKDSQTLISSGIAIQQDFDNKINYEFTALNEIKPAMIEEATKNAREVAVKFAKDSNSQVGKIKNASQGVFSIENASGGLEDKKRVRVVTQIEYFLK